jgi:hypothetical protein
MIHKILSGGAVVRLDRWALWRLTVAQRWAEWKDRRAGRLAGGGGLTAKQAREYVAWLEGHIAFHRSERTELRGIAGMDEQAYYNKLEASTLERARTAFVAIAGVTDEGTTQ